MKILFISQYYEPEPFIIHEKVKGLRDLGYEVTVITGLPNYPTGEIYKYYKPGIEIKDKVKIIRVPMKPRKSGAKNLFLNYVSFAYSANRLIGKLNKSYDIVYVYQLSPVFMIWPAFKAKLKYNAKLIVYCLDLWPESLVSGGIKSESIIYNIFKYISRYLYSKADSIHISSRNFEKYFREVLKIDKTYIYNPQYALQENFNNIKSYKYLNQNKINLTFTGNIGEMQSVETLINAMKYINDSNIVLNIVGDGSKFKDIKDIVEINNLTNIKLWGRYPQEEMKHFINESDALMISMKNNKIISYTLPAKLLSYLQSGKFIIGSIDGEANDVIKNSNAGIASKAEDVDALVKNILYFANNFKELKDKGKNGKLYYLNNFGKDKFINIIDKDIHKLCKTNIKGGVQ